MVGSALAWLSSAPSASTGHAVCTSVRAAGGDLGFVHAASETPWSVRAPVAAQECQFAMQRLRAWLSVLPKEPG
jgi:hypothetical protein